MHRRNLLLDDNWSDVVSSLLVVLAMTAIAVGPVLGLPAATEGRLLRNVLHVDHVHHLGLVLADVVVAASAVFGRAAGPCRRTVGQVGGVAESGHHHGGWDQGQPILDCKRNQVNTECSVF